MNRRHFLKNSTSLILLPLIAPIRSFASTETSRYADVFFVMIRMEGGWDITLSLDPKIHGDVTTQEDIFIEYRPEDIFSHNSLKLGPASLALKPHLQDIAVINGMLMNTSDNGHDSSLSYISTGNGDGTASSLAIELAATTSQGPFGVAFKGDLRNSGRKVMLSTTEDLLNLKESIRFPDLGGYFGANSGSGNFGASLNELIANSEIQDAFISELKNREQLMEEASDDMGKPAHIIASAFASGASFQGQIDLYPDLDTHSNHERSHLQSQKQGWDQVAEIFKIFKDTPYGENGESLFSKTTFMVVSEFSRTAALNSAGGKDHNPLTNSVLLAGNGVVGGQSFGESHVITKSQSQSGMSQHAALPVDLKTGQVARTRLEAKAKEFTYITPDLVVASIAKSLGVNEAEFRSTHLNRQLLSKVLKNSI